MTANQLANRANQLQEQRNAEDARHNKAYENEVNRHNVEVETLSNNQLELDKDKNRFEKYYKSASLYLESERNGIQSRLATATSVNNTASIQLKERLADIEQQKTLLDADYKNYMMSYNDKMYELNSKIQAETELHNRNTESISWAKTQIDQQLADIEAKRLEYQNNYWNQSIGIERTKVSNQFYLGLENINLTRGNLDLATLRQQKEAELWDSQIGSNITKGISNTFAGFGQVLGAIKILSAF